MAIKYSDGCEIFQMTIKCTNILNSKASKIYPNWEFWFENKPSGNPGTRQSSARQDRTLKKFCWTYLPIYIPTWILKGLFIGRFLEARLSSTS
jgi:hypothetical protein